MEMQMMFDVEVFPVLCKFHFMFLKASTEKLFMIMKLHLLFVRTG